MREALVLGPDEDHPQLPVGADTVVIRSGRVEFPDGEQLVCLEGTAGLAGTHVLITQSTRPPQDRNLVTLLQLIDAVAATGPASISCFVPYLCYQRQDRRFEPGQALSADLVVRLLRGSGVRKVFTVEKHSTAHDRPVTSELVTDLHITELLADLCRQRGVAPDVVVAPDSGARARCRGVARSLGKPLVVLEKKKAPSRGTYYESIPDEVGGAHCLVIDDLCSSGSTLRPLCEELTVRSATVSVFVIHLLVPEETLRRRVPMVDHLAYSDSCGDRGAPIRLLPAALRAWREEVVRNEAHPTILREAL